MAHMANMDFARWELAVSQIPCPGPEVEDVPIALDDWASSRVAEFYKSGVTLRSVHVDMYRTRRGCSICLLKG